MTATSPKYAFTDPRLPKKLAQPAGEEYAKLKKMATDPREQVRELRRRRRDFPTLCGLVFNKGAREAAEDYYIHRLMNVRANLVIVPIEVTRAQSRPPIRVNIAGPEAYPKVGGSPRDRDEVLGDAKLRRRRVLDALAILQQWVDRWGAESLVELKPLVDDVALLLEKARRELNPAA